MQRTTDPNLQVESLSRDEQELSAEETATNDCIRHKSTSNCTLTELISPSSSYVFGSYYGTFASNHWVLQIIECASILCLVILVNGVILGLFSSYIEPLQHLSVAFLSFLTLVWPILRFGSIGGATSVLVIYMVKQNNLYIC
jgi:hypothetical protein